MQARSIIPGRQRWDIGTILTNPRVTELLESRLRQAPGVEVVHANPITGRLLVCHDKALTSRDVEQLVREAVALSIQEAAELRQSSRTIRARKQQRRRVGWILPFAGLVGGTVLALIRENFFRRSLPWSSRSVPAPALAILSRTWEESLPLERAILSSPFIQLSLSPSSLLFHILPPHLLSGLPLSTLSSFTSSPLLFVLLSSPLSSIIPAPFRSLLSSASSFSSNPLTFVGSRLVEHQQNRDLPFAPPVNRRGSRGTPAIPET